LRLAKIFINGFEAISTQAASGKASYELMNNSHSFYQIGKKEDSGETLHGFVGRLKVFKRVLSNIEIWAEMGGKTWSKYFIRN